MTQKKLKIERDWLEEALKIADDLHREMFIYTCIGIALDATQFCGPSGFEWPEVQELWDNTKIVKVSKDKDGKIGWKRITAKH